MRHFSLFSAAIMATMLLFAGCDPVEEPAPVLTPTTEGTIQIPAAGGSGKITYTLENAAKDGNIEFKDTILVLYHMPEMEVGKKEEYTPSFNGRRVLYNPQYNFVSKPYENTSNKEKQVNKLLLTSKYIILWI